ncbi:MAG TPA: aquaporin [Candidatus Eisenbacteria bacterium]|nr:aquaporin [Candidatus Eisenbacteria bacterium]
MGALRRHWPEYLMEAAGLGIFMISACGFGTLLEYPGSPVHQAIPDPFARRAWMGLAMGLTAVGLIYSPWGQRSGAHFNPSVTWTFFRLGKVAPADAVWYPVAQAMGGLAGVLAMAALLGPSLADPPVHYVATLPGPGGVAPAFLGEVAISFLLMSVVLIVSNHPRWARYTGLCAGALVAAYITFEAPVSGMSMNPARSFASALPAMTWRDFWLYLVAPPLGMLLAAEVHSLARGAGSVACAKLHHQNSRRCIFCEWQRGRTERGELAAAEERGAV